MKKSNTHIHIHTHTNTLAWSGIFETNRRRGGRASNQPTKPTNKNHVCVTTQWWFGKHWRGSRKQRQQRIPPPQEKEKPNKNKSFFNVLHMWRCAYAVRVGDCKQARRGQSNKGEEVGGMGGRRSARVWKGQRSSWKVAARPLWGRK